MEMHTYRMHHIARLLLKNEGQRIMKEFSDLQGETIPKYLSLSESLEYSLKEVSFIWKNGTDLNHQENSLLQLMKNFTENTKV
jgi:hypothetical protein